jgi:hypothetical protein
LCVFVFSHFEHLSQLPPEALRDILDWVNGDELGALWFCGDSLLNWKLGKGGAARRFEIDAPQLYRLAWPTLVSSFEGLQEFSILKCYLDPCNVKITAGHLLSLPKSLKKLGLAFPGNACALWTVLRDAPNHFADLEHLDMNWNTNTITDEEKELSKVARLPAKLSTLRWACAYSAIYYPPTDSCLSLENLPRSLTSLTLQAMRSATPAAGFKLPLGLVKVAGQFLYSLLLLPLLSDGGVLQSLELKVNGAKETFVEQMERIPRSVTHLQLYHEAANEEDGVEEEFELTEGMLLALPPHLRHFSTNAHNLFSNPKLVKLLPRTLTSTSDNFGVNADSARELPPGLQGYALRDLALLPLLPHPKTLFFNFGRFNPTNDATPLPERLPNSIQVVEGFSTLLTAAQVRLLAPLTNLRSVNISTNPEITNEVLRCLPSNIHYLGLDSQNIPFDVAMCASLPRGLQRLRLTTTVAEGTSETELAAAFPPQLKSLDGPNFPNPSAAFYEKLPRSLTSLSLNTDHLEALAGLGNGFTPLQTLEISSKAKKADWTFWESLPSSLRSFTLRLSPPEEEKEEGVKAPLIKVLPEDIARLPRHLRTLSLQGVDLDVQSILPHLPRTLLRLSTPRYHDSQLFVPPIMP